MENTNLQHAPHYEKGRTISPFDVIIDWELDFFLGNVVKYIARIGRKYSAVLSKEEKSIEDIDKAIVYLQKEREIISKYLNK